MKRLLLGAAVGVALGASFAQSAHAKAWWSLDHVIGKCHALENGPQTEIDLMRSQGMFPMTRRLTVPAYWTGTTDQIVVELKGTLPDGEHQYVYEFPTKTMCDKDRIEGSFPEQEDTITLPSG
jgi:hypothetical protein